MGNVASPRCRDRIVALPRRSIVRWPLVLVLAIACGGDLQRAPEPDKQVAGVRWPPMIDSHVHVRYWPVADRLPATGIAAVVDLAAPERTLGSSGEPAALTVIAAGPMLTRPGGYPLDAWGSAGYGIGCADAACVRVTVDRLAGEGARVIKLALGPDGLDPGLVADAVAAAHARKLKVAAHALDDASARVAAKAGVDVLAHTPTEPLSDATVAAWKHGAVISTLAAFGAPAAVDNLRKLHAAGCTVLYGTDLGNLRDAGPSAEEVALLARAGLDDAAITAAMTTEPARFWGLEDRTSYLILDRDPRVDARALLAPRSVWLRGRRIR